MEDLGTLLCKPWIAFGLAWSTFAVGFSIYMGTRVPQVPKPRPPIYRDVNGDGVKDKIIQRGVPDGGIFGPLARLEDEVLYGIDINGKRIYLPQEQFNGLER